MKEIYQKLHSYFNERHPLYQKAGDIIAKSMGDINVETDIKAYVAENATKIPVPADIPYQPWTSDVPSPVPGSNPNLLSSSSQGNAPPAMQPSTKKSSTNLGKHGPNGQTKDALSSREWGLSAADVKALSSEQKTAKLKGQTEDLEKMLNSETKSREGLENLVRFYSNDPASAKKAEDEIHQSEMKIQRINETLSLVHQQLEELGDSADSSSSPAAGKPSNNNNSGKKDAAKNSSGVRVRGIYEYSATCDTELSFTEGEMLTITEQDNSGWWYAVADDGRAGFVPNNYVEIVG
jgi:hypothetical protein